MKGSRNPTWETNAPIGKIEVQINSYNSFLYLYLAVTL